MKRNSLALSILAAGLALGDAATAQTQLDSIVVRPTTGGEMTFHCGNLYNPRPIDVEALLDINDRTQTQNLSNKLVDAMSEACAAGIPTIIVERGKSGGSVVWYPAAPVAGYVARTVYAEPVVVEPAYVDAPYVEPAYVDEVYFED